MRIVGFHLWTFETAEGVANAYSATQLKGVF
jgi:hypothetical protein